MQARLCLKPDLAELESLSLWCSTLSLEGILQPQALNLVLEELFVNSLSHALPNPESQKPGCIEIYLSLLPDALRIEYRDAGKAFAPKDTGVPSLPQSLELQPVGGLGWPLIRHYVDDISFYHNGSMNIITLTKIRSNDGNNNSSAG